MRAVLIPSSYPALQACAPTPRISPTTSIARTALRHGSRVSLLAMSLMLAFPATSHAGGGGGEGAFATNMAGGDGAGYDGAGNPTTGGTAAGPGVAGGGVGATGGVGNPGGGGGGGIGSIANAPSGLLSTTTGGSGGDSLSLGGGGGGGDGAILTSGGTLNVTVKGGDGGGGVTGGGGGSGLAFSTTSGATLTVQSAVTGGAGGGGSDSGGGGGSGIWVTANGAVDVTTGTVTGGSGGASSSNDNGDGGGGVIFSGAGGQVHVGGSAQIVGGAASGSGTGGAGINVLGGGGTVTIDSGAIVAGGLGGTSAVIAVPGLSKGGIGSGGAAGGDPTSVHSAAGGIGLIASGGNNTIITSGAINGGTGFAGQAAAVRLNGGGNTLELRAGYSFIGSVVSISGTTNGGDTLTLGGATNATFDATSIRVGGQYDGFTSFSKTGNSNWTLTGIGTFSGNTDISGGTLSVNGDFSSSAQINVNNGGALGGTGTVGNVSVHSGGILAPGNSIGTLHVNGDLIFNSGAIYRVEANAAGSADRTDVIGALSLAGTVDVQAGAGSYAPNTSYTILTNTGVQSGTFAGVTSNLAFLTPTLSYLPNAVLLNLARNGTSFTDVANTHNQQAVANALQNVGAGAAGDIGTVVNAVTNLSADQARASFDTIGGAGLISMRRANLSFAGGFNNQVIARLNAVGTAANVQQTAFNTPVLLAANDHVSDLMPMLAQQSYSLDSGATQIGAAASGNHGFWLRGYGNDQSTDGDINASGSRQRDVGISAGFDARVNDNLVAGFALTHDHAEVDAGSQTGNSNGNAAALYAGYANGPWNVNGVLSYAHNSNSTQRRIAFGSIDRTAVSDFGSRTLSLYGDVTYDVPLAGWTLQPLAGLSLSSNAANGFTETGADALNLQVAGQTVQSTKSLFGAKALIEVRKIQLQPRLIWAHEFGNADSAAMTAQLQGAPTPFSINGVDVPRNSLIAGLTIAGQASERVSVFADVQEEFNSSQNKLGLLLGLHASW
jgi:uncharacterized protein with beta-barrel porin domain